MARNLPHRICRSHHHPPLLHLPPALHLPRRQALRLDVSNPTAFPRIIHLTLYQARAGNSLCTQVLEQRDAVNEHFQKLRTLLDPKWYIYCIFHIPSELHGCATGYGPSDAELDIPRCCPLGFWRTCESIYASCIEQFAESRGYGEGNSEGFWV